MPNLVVSAVAKWNGSALKKGERQLTQFQKSTNMLAKSFAAAFGVRKIVQFGKASVAAFAADEKAAKSLSIALRNTGNGFATVATEGFIARMQDTYKVLDDELRPAFQTLVNATGSLTKAQDGLQLSLDIAAGTGKDLQSVSAALAKGFTGNTTALSRLGAGLDKATLKSGDMEKIIAKLQSKFQGQGLAATKTYTGQIDSLAIASANAQEEIGKGLLDSIALLGGSGGINTATSNMEGFGKAIGDATFGMATLIKTFADSPIAKVLSTVPIFKTPGIIAKLGANARGSTTGKGVAYSPTSMYFTTQTAIRAKETAEIKKGVATKKEANKLSAAELADKKKQSELDALKKKFDVDRINLETALANSKDEAEKARIRSLLTIMDDDANSAAKRMAELDKANMARLDSEYRAAISLGNLAEAAKYAAMGVKEFTLGGVALSQYDRFKDSPVFQKAIEIEAQKALDDSESALAEAIASATRAGVSAQELGAITNITINTPVGSEEALTEAVQKAVQQLNRYGSSTAYAGAIPL